MRPRIVGFCKLRSDAAAVAAVDAIFFEASATQSFASDADRAAFRERWLGRFLTQFTDGCFVALGPAEDILGYVVGATEDPALDPRFSDIGYFQGLATETRRFPAHLHINLAPQARNRGIGGHLIEAFCAHARGKGATGVHVVTSATSRNRTFYARAGFVHAVEANWNGHAIVFLGRSL